MEPGLNETVLLPPGMIVNICDAYGTGKNDTIVVSCKSFMLEAMVGIPEDDLMATTFGIIDQEDADQLLSYLRHMQVVC